MSTKVSPLEKIIGYCFVDKKLLETALQHSSYVNEQRKPMESCNERLEFLGDSILSLIVAEALFKQFADSPEGFLTKTRASLVCETALKEYADEIDLGSHILLGKGEERTGGRTRASILSDAFEAVIAAIYLDGGLNNAQKFVLRFVSPRLKENGNFDNDFKTRLQENIQKKPNARADYILLKEDGPDHAKEFEVLLRFNSKDVARGRGKSKKLAEQDAARQALDLIDFHK